MLAPSPDARALSGGCIVSFISRFSCAGVGAGRIFLSGNSISCTSAKGAIRLLAVALTAATLAACAQGPGASYQPNSLTASRHGPDGDRRSASAARRATTKVAKSEAGETPKASDGIASFYRPTRTANGEKGTNELTAAHRTLPFGTRVRVTDVSTGKSVTVRVNDRGPFIPGRVVDISHTAAESLGITGRGIAKVKLDVVE
jgi:rare lipoprotein A